MPRTTDDDTGYDPEDPDDPLNAADAEADRRVLGWGGPTNPNSAEGEIQNMSAFAASAVTATGWRRTAAKVFAWGALIFIVGYVVVIVGFAVKLV